MLLESLRKQVLETALQMVSDGLAFGAGGNVSALDRESGLLAITPSALDYHKMAPDDVVVIDKLGKVVEGKWKPTSEMPMHTIFYRERDEVGAVVHTHAPYASIFAVINESVPLVITEAALCIGAPVRVAPYCRPGTEELARIVLDTMGQEIAVLLGQHGLITVGANLGQAYSSTIATEMSARVTFMARSMRAEPQLLNLEEVAELRQLYLRHYRPSAAKS